MVLPIGLKTIEDLTLLPTTTEAPPYMNLIQQLIVVFNWNHFEMRLLNLRINFFRSAINKKINSQQLIEFQRENIESWKQETLNWPSRNNYVWKPKKPMIELDSSDSAWALFLDAWG